MALASTYMHTIPYPKSEILGQKVYNFRGEYVKKTISICTLGLSFNNCWILPRKVDSPGGTQAQIATKPNGQLEVWRWCDGGFSFAQVIEDRSSSNGCLLAIAGTKLYPFLFRNMDDFFDWDREEGYFKDDTGGTCWFLMTLASCFFTVFFSLFYEGCGVREFWQVTWVLDQMYFECNWMARVHWCRGERVLKIRWF